MHITCKHKDADTNYLTEKSGSKLIFYPIPMKLRAQFQYSRASVLSNASMLSRQALLASPKQKFSTLFEASYAVYFL